MNYNVGTAIEKYRNVKMKELAVAREKQRLMVAVARLATLPGITAVDKADYFNATAEIDREFDERYLKERLTP